jgi:hypothetical protein
MLVPASLRVVKVFEELDVAPEASRNAGGKST